MTITMTMTMTMTLAVNARWDSELARLSTNWSARNSKW